MDKDAKVGIVLRGGGGGGGGGCGGNIGSGRALPACLHVHRAVSRVLVHYLGTRL